MKALEILKHIHCELSKNNATGIWIDPNIVKEALDELENIKSIKHSDYPITANTSSKDCCLSLEKRITHIENTLEEIFRASAYNKDALNKNRTVWHYFKSKQ